MMNENFVAPTEPKQGGGGGGGGRGREKGGEALPDFSSSTFNFNFNVDRRLSIASYSSESTASLSSSRRPSLGHEGEREGGDSDGAGLLRRKSSGKSSRRILLLPLGNFGGPLDAGKTDERDDIDNETTGKGRRTSLSKPELAI